MNVLLVGATGLLGSHLAERLPQSFATSAARPRAGRGEHQDALTWLDHELDATDASTIDPVLRAAAPAVIVNAIAMTATPDESTAADMWTVNATFPHWLASRAEVAGARVVQISTDGVFSGGRGGYAEGDAPDPADEYGRSKLAGELGPPHLTLRTSFFGQTRRKTGLIEWLKAQRGPVVDGFTDYRFSGIAARLLAEFVATALISPTRLEGVYHVGGDAFTKYDLLGAASESLHLGLRVAPIRSVPIDRTLNSDRFFAAIGGRRPSLADSLRALSPCAPARLGGRGLR